MQKLKLRSQWKDFGVFVCFMLDKLEMKKEQVISEEILSRENIFISKRVKNTEQRLRYI